MDYGLLNSSCSTSINTDMVTDGGGNEQQDHLVFWYDDFNIWVIYRETV